ncbi:alpha/beta hydrolase [Thermomonospora umbrina]|uniref:Alpha/beta hydrolase family protein n=1 Tax=Thermomonospora umbrina TaxID=111806 RepID=A0A3D9SKR2_9ACTN|nr:alpha/beta hydrolase [Thermomonospora umbrina]REE96478.1 alpha/beta hydrolase family protein [Thermomonospora umbrina]
MSTVGRIVPTLAASLLVAGCWSGDTAKRVAPDAALKEQCASVPDGATRVTLRAVDGTGLGAAVVGPATARVGVALAHGATQTLCDWLGYARTLASATGSRVLVVDRRGVGSSEGPANLGRLPGDLVTGARWLRSGGAERIVLMGSSMGSAGALGAAHPTGPRTAVTPRDPQAPLLDPPACAVVAVSPVTRIADDRGAEIDVSGISSLPMPAWLAYEQGNPGVRAAAETLAARSRGASSPGVRLRSVPGDDHGIALIDEHADVRRFLEDAVRSCR